CLIPDLVGGCVVVGPYNGLQAWGDNLNARVPLTQSALENVTLSFEEYQAASSLKRGQVFPRLPIAYPGPNRIIEGNTIGGADVMLDGSRSFDPDGRPLTNYTWSGDFGEATGVIPTIHLTLGFHDIQLVVGNGMNYSLPSSFSVTVVHTTPPTVHIEKPQEGL